MRRILAGLILALAVALGTVAMAVHGPQANAATVSRTRAACIAFQTWNHHRTAANLTRMLQASKRAHVSAVIKTDIVVVYTEKVQNDWYDLPADVHSTARDCQHAR
ncbi:MAG TPA: hypothetical protein VFE08_14450 [Candidatus Sulfotelmatobacter sp.]|jgi:hypothetical protein|nr:hypothetical protein [Candidatus Sulfotelmatobacter sp.]